MFDVTIIKIHGVWGVELMTGIIMSMGNPTLAMSTPPLKHS